MRIPSRLGRESRGLRRPYLALAATLRAAPTRPLARGKSVILTHRLLLGNTQHDVLCVADTRPITLTTRKWSSQGSSGPGLHT